MDRIRVLLVDDHTIVRKGIRSLLDEVPAIDVIGEAANGREAVEMVADLNPDVVVLDVAMPELNGIEATRQIKQLYPHVRVLILTMYTNEEYVFQLLHAGAAGYLIKQSAPAELTGAIQAVYRGDSFFSPSVSRTIADEYLKRSSELRSEDSYDKLTTREREVLQLIAEGYSNAQIADRLCISPKTAAVHRVNLMDKLDLHSTTELVKYAIRKGVISLD